MNMKKLTALLLVLLLLLTGCGADTTKSDETEPSPSAGVGESAGGDEIVELPDVYPVDGLEEIAVENPINSFFLTMGESYDTTYMLNAYTNDNGSATVEYSAQEKKLGPVAASVLHNLTKAFEESGLTAFNGKSEYSDAQGFASMYVCYADGTVVAADYSGNVPEDFKKGFEKMEAHFRLLTANIPLYVPAPVVAEGVNAGVQEEMLQILNNSGMEALDSFVISDVPVDEFFAELVGLSGSEGIKNGTSCAPMMMTTPYSLVIVTLENENRAGAVCKDFEDSINWRKWVCVAPTNALIARKGNMVLCLMGSDTLFTSTENAVKAAQWKIVETLTNPDL